MNKEKAPWYQSWKNAHRRCNDPKNNRYQYYGARGITSELTFWETGYLFLRDKANRMKKPQLHRFDNRKGYYVENCCFMGAAEHSRLTHTGLKRSLESRRRMTEAGGTQYADKHPKAKLSNAIVRSIRKQLATKTGVELSKKYSVSTALISAIKLNKIRRRG